MKAIFVSECVAKHECVEKFVQDKKLNFEMAYSKQALVERNTEDLDELLKDKGLRSYYQCSLQCRVQFCTIVEKAVLELDGCADSPKFPWQVTKEMVNSPYMIVLDNGLPGWYTSWMIVTTADGVKHFECSRRVLYHSDRQGTLMDRLEFLNEFADPTQLKPFEQNLSSALMYIGQELAPPASADAQPMFKADWYTPTETLLFHQKNLLT